MVVAIDVADIAIRNQERFVGKRVLFVTGERAEESPGRAKYKTYEPHRADNREGVRTRRRIDHCRPVHGRSEAQIWEIIERHGINPHPAYRLGWGRVSCMACIFGSANQWASLRKIMPNRFWEIRGYESQFGVTIQRDKSILDMANKGTAYPGTDCQTLVAEALDHNWNGPAVITPWVLPAGSFGDKAGPI